MKRKSEDIEDDSKVEGKPEAENSAVPVTYHPVLGYLFDESVPLDKQKEYMERHQSTDSGSIQQNQRDNPLTLSQTQLNQNQLNQMQLNLSEGIQRNLSLLSVLQNQSQLNVGQPGGNDTWNLQQQQMSQLSQLSQIPQIQQSINQQENLQDNSGGIKVEFSTGPSLEEYYAAAFGGGQPDRNTWSEGKPDLASMAGASDPQLQLHVNPFPTNEMESNAGQLQQQPLVVWDTSSMAQLQNLTASELNRGLPNSIDPQVMQNLISASGLTASQIFPMVNALAAQNVNSQAEMWEFSNGFPLFIFYLDLTCIALRIHLLFCF